MLNQKRLRFVVVQGQGKERVFDVRVGRKWLDRSVEDVARKSFGSWVANLASEPDTMLVRSLPAEQQVRVLSRDLVVVTSVSESYLPMFELWQERVPRTVEIVVCCFDAYSAKHVRRGRVVSRKATTRSEMWIQRLETVIEVCAAESERPVVHSDIDAFWLGDPRDSDAFIGNAFSVDHGLGRGLKTFALCCGFYRLESKCLDTVPFLRRWRNLTATVGDDQLALNALYDAGDLSVNLLPYEQFARCNSHHRVSNPPLVWHPWLDADIFSKLHVWAQVLTNAANGDWTIIRVFYDLFGPAAATPPNSYGVPSQQAIPRSLGVAELSRILQHLREQHHDGG